jgi:hypothetical protein
MGGCRDLKIVIVEVLLTNYKLMGAQGPIC